MKRDMKREWLRHGASAVVCAGLMVVMSLGVVAQERTGRFQRTVDFDTPKTVNLDTMVGPVKITTVEFSDLGRGYSGGGFAARMRAGSDSEASTALRAKFLIDNPRAEEWELTITLELLDRDGKIIDKLTKKNDYENETATWNIEHPLLEYVMPMVSEVRITIEGRVQ